MGSKTASRLKRCQIPAKRNTENKNMSEILPLSWARAPDTILQSNMTPCTHLISWRGRSRDLKSLLLIGFYSFCPRVLKMTHSSLKIWLKELYFHVLYNTLVAGAHPRSARSKSSSPLCLKCSSRCLPSPKEVWECSPVLLWKLFL